MCLFTVYEKILICSIIAITRFSVNSQVTFGIHGNVIGANIKETDFLNYGATTPDETLDWKQGTRASWKFGVVMNLPLSENFSFQPQLNVLNKGGKFSTFYSMSEQGETIELDIDADIKLTYIELPLNFVYNSNKFFIGAGPSLSYGVDGELVAKVKFVYDDGVDRYEDSGSETEEIEFNNEEDEEQPSLKPFELGANFIAGYKIKDNIFVNVHYNLGLSNISNYEDTEFKNRYFGIGIAYIFNKK